MNMNMFASVWVEGPFQPFIVPLPTNVSSSEGVAPNALYFPSYRSRFNPSARHADILRLIQQTDKKLKYTELLFYYLRFIKHTRLDPKYFDDLHEIYFATKNGKVPLQAKVPKSLASKFSANRNTKQDTILFDALPEIKDIIRIAKKPSSSLTCVGLKNEKSNNYGENDVSSCGTKVDCSDEDEDEDGDHSSDYSDSMEHVLDFLNFSSDDEIDHVYECTQEGNVKLFKKDIGNDVDNDDWETFLDKLVAKNGAHISSPHRKTSRAQKKKTLIKTKVRSQSQSQSQSQSKQLPKSFYQYQSPHLSHLQTKPLFNGGSNLWSYNVMSSDVDWSMDTHAYAPTSV